MVDGWALRPSQSVHVLEAMALAECSLPFLFWPWNSPEQSEAVGMGSGSNAMGQEPSFTFYYLCTIQ